MRRQMSNGASVGDGVHASGTGRVRRRRQHGALLPRESYQQLVRDLACEWEKVKAKCVKVGETTSLQKSVFLRLIVTKS